ncbi:hypothetical protein WAE56_01470 [Iodobacter sp. LRB]|uniref:hypothetical protein n=1 Tax=unclassified Iodobacter TaxID=235634 RepID=UPI000C0F4565|nr:hypothetical protein [Iodobacter sp. BJB302]PHV01509.1 hypothetical protein CSQ88_11720 [Iodobacter sp. BJB302]
MGRTKNSITETVELPALPAEKIMADQQLASRMEAAFSDEQRQVTQMIGERIGRRSMALMIGKLLSVTDLIDLQRIKESKQYKGFKHLDESGNWYSITTWEEYCQRIEGRSREAIDVDINHLKQLGPELFDAMRQIGIGPGTMRDLRQLPEDEKAVIAEAAKSDDKEALLELIDDLSAKHAKEKEQAKAALAASEKAREESQSNYQALSKLQANTNAERDQLKIELAKREKLIAEMDPIDVGDELRVEVSQKVSAAEIALRLLKKPFAALAEHTEQHGFMHDDFMAGLLGQLQFALNQLRGEFSIKEAPDGEVMPAWMREEAPLPTAQEEA